MKSKGKLNNSILGKVDIIELTKLRVGLKKVIKFAIGHVEFGYLGHLHKYVMEVVGYMKLGHRKKKNPICNS